MLNSSDYAKHYASTIGKSLRGKGRERGLTSFSLSPSYRTQRAFVFLPPQPPDDTKGRFSNDEGDDSENVTFKMNKRFSNFVVSIPIH